MANESSLTPPPEGGGNVGEGKVTLTFAPFLIAYAINKAGTSQPQIPPLIISKSSSLSSTVCPRLESGRKNEFIFKVAGVRGS